MLSRVWSAPEKAVLRRLSLRRVAINVSAQAGAINSTLARLALAEVG